MSKDKVYRSAVDGKFVTEEEAREHPDTTVAEAVKEQRPTTLMEDIKGVLNRYSRENDSNTPDSILAIFIVDCLWAFEQAVNRRDKQHNHPGEEPS